MGSLRELEQIPFAISIQDLNRQASLDRRDHFAAHALLSVNADSISGNLCVSAVNGVMGTGYSSPSRDLNRLTAVKKSKIYTRVERLKSVDRDASSMRNDPVVLSILNPIGSKRCVSGAVSHRVLRRVFTGVTDCNRGSGNTRDGDVDPLLERIPSHVGVRCMKLMDRNMVFVSNGPVTVAVASHIVSYASR